MPLQYVQLITDKTNAADLSGGVFAILNNVTWMEKNTKFIAVSQILSETDIDVTKEALNCSASL